MTAKTPQRVNTRNHAPEVDHVSIAAGPGVVGAGPGVVGAGPGVVAAGPGVVAAGPGVTAGAGPGVVAAGPGVVAAGLVMYEVRSVVGVTVQHRVMPSRGIPGLSTHIVCQIE